MKVLFDQRVIPNYRLGVFKLLSNQKGIDLTVSYWGKRFDYEPKHVENIEEFKTVRFTPLIIKILGKTIWINFSLIKYIILEKPDIIIGRTGIFGPNTVFSLPVELACSFFFECSFIFRISQKLPKSSNAFFYLCRDIFYKIYFHKRLILTYTENAAKAIISSGADPKNVFVDYNSLDTNKIFETKNQIEATINLWKEDFYLEYNIPRNKFILFFSRLLPEKRVDLLVSAWRLVEKKYENITLVIVGVDSSNKSLIKETSDLGQKICLIKPIYDDFEIAKFFTMSSLVIYPGYATLSTQYAMCFAKAIITSEYGNEVEYIQNYKSGLRYAYGDVDDLAKKIVQLLDDKKLSKKLGENAFLIVKEKINIENMVRIFTETIMKAKGLNDD